VSCVVRAAPSQYVPGSPHWLGVALCIIRIGAELDVVLSRGIGWRWVPRSCPLSLVGSVSCFTNEIGRFALARERHGNRAQRTWTVSGMGVGWAGGWDWLAAGGSGGLQKCTRIWLQGLWPDGEQTNKNRNSEVALPTLYIPNCVRNVANISWRPILFPAPSFQVTPDWSTAPPAQASQSMPVQMSRCTEGRNK